MRTPESVRARFPGVCGTSTALLDHAGSSPIPGCVIDAATNYMRRCFVQVGADYDLSRQAAATVKAAHDFVATFLNAGPDHRVVLGPSTTALAHILANAIADAFAKGDLPRGRDEIVVCSAGHEANVWPWARLADRVFTIRWWHASPDPDRTLTLDAESLRRLLGPRTCLVAFPHVSNILGDVWNARELCRMAREAGARSVVDGVAYAPHRLPDVAAIGCDWYLYSTYKVYGPCMAAMAGRLDAFEPLTGPNHPFIAREDLPYKFELGGACREGSAMIAASYEHFAWLADASPSPPFDRTVLERAFREIESIELPLQRRLLEGLRRVRGIRLIGPWASDASRVCTVSFVIEGRSSRETVQRLNAAGLGCRHGHFYSRRLVEQVGLDPADGVIRISLSHPNDQTEVDRVLDALLG
ncbi:MAG: aminotransferase class V-fold PLP-dependent enzyme [Phycisphaerae bacterium]